ncbi:BTAD domain-containing putative transcriptional regulator [Streptomyces sp. PTY087I2]|uniref:AfsR/SARP family transcriptional regulator n=1 Tax=Streptomyces sp. PTY087I2 TaxID=1819298 RepID=UPI00159ECF0A|nr:BTAD domain-containing putative transcriptional regulator [Streptomyces sp. PTY087I2]
MNSPKQRVLLGVLLVRMDSVVPTDTLINELWGRNAPDKAINALQAHVSRLRQQLIEAEPPRANTPRLIARGSGYLLQARPEELDSVQFRLQTTRARRQLATDAEAAAALLRRALGLWRGPALDGGSHGPLCAGVAARLEEERLLAVEDLCEASIRLGRHRQVVGRLEELVSLHPQRDRFREQLAVALQQGGAPTVRRLRAPEGDRGALGSAVRQIYEAGHGRGGPWALEHAEEEGVGDHAHPREEGDDLELVRLRRRVEQLSAEQRSMRADLDRLTALVERGGAAQRRDSA